MDPSLETPPEPRAKTQDTECPALRAISSPVFIKTDQNLYGFHSMPLALLVCCLLYVTLLGWPYPSSPIEQCALIQGQLMVPKVNESSELEKNKHEICKKLKKQDM